MMTRTQAHNDCASLRAAAAASHVTCNINLAPASLIKAARERSAAVSNRELAEREALCQRVKVLHESGHQRLGRGGLQFDPRRAQAARRRG